MSKHEFGTLTALVLPPLSITLRGQVAVQYREYLSEQVRDLAEACISQLTKCHYVEPALLSIWADCVLQHGVPERVELNICETLSKGGNAALLLECVRGNSMVELIYLQDVEKFSNYGI